MESVASIVAVMADSYRKKGVITDFTFRPDKLKHPMFSTVTTREEVGFGKGHIVHFQTGITDAVGPDFSTAQARAKTTATGAGNGYDSMTVTQGNTIDGFAYIKRKAIKEARASYNPMAMRDVVKNAMEGCMDAFRLRLTHAFSGAGWGKLATIVAAPTSGTITVAARKAPLFTVGLPLVAAQYESTGALRSATAINVTGVVVNPVADTCVVSLDADPTGLSWASGDTVFQKGYRENSATPTRLMPSGMGAWCPFAAATDTFFGKARTGRPELYGMPVDCSSYPDIITALITLGDFAADAGHTWDFIALNGASFSKLTASKERQKLGEFSGKVGPYQAGFDGFSIFCNNKKVPILRDTTLDDGQFRAGPFEDPKKGPYVVMNQGDDIINLDDFDGSKMVRASDDAAYELRYYSDIQFVVPCPKEYTSGYGLPAL